MMSRPAVSVILPVFNEAQHIGRAIEGILGQTMTDFELIIVDDGSTDATSEVIETYADRRIRVISLATNVGLSRALNLGVHNAQAPLIARQDADDVSLPDRLKIQQRFMSDHPEVGLIGTWADIVAEGGKSNHSKKRHRHPRAGDIINWRLLWNNPFVHSSVMFRRPLFLELGGYPESDDEFPEDYALWSSLSQITSLANIPKCMVRYQQSAGGVSQSRREEVIHGVTDISVRNILRTSSWSIGGEQARQISQALNSFPMTALTPQQAFHNFTEFARLTWKVLGGTTFVHLPSIVRAHVKILVRSLRPAPGLQ